MQQYPHTGGLVNLQGILHARQNDFVAARHDFEEAVHLMPQLTPAWQNLARACQMTAEQDPSAAACAVRSWQHVQRLKPDDAEAHSALGLLYERTGKYTDSLRELQALPPEIASQTGNLLLTAADLAALHRIPASKAAAQQLIGRSDFSEADFDTVQTAFDNTAAAPVAVILVESLDRRQAAGVKSLRQLAIAYEQLHRPLDARRTLERVALLDPQNTAHLIELARLADEAKDYEGALGYLAHARDLAPADAQIHFLFAMIASKMNLPVEARASLTRALAIDPANPAYNYAMGFVTLSTRDAATAASYFQKFVTARPDNPKGRYALGVAHFASGDYVKAKQEMETVENDPKTAGGADYFLGRIARQEDRLPDATRLLKKSIELFPTFAESHTELARVLMLQGDLAGAHRELELALAIDPDSFQANSQLLVVYRRTHDERAGKQAERVKQLDDERSKRAELMLRTIEARP